MRETFPRARAMHQAAGTIGTTSEGAIRNAGFDIILKKTEALPNHHRIIHPDGAAGFSDQNLARLAETFVTTLGH